MNNLVLIESRQPKMLFKNIFYLSERADSFEEKLLFIGAILSIGFSVIMIFFLFGIIPFTIVIGNIAIGAAIGIRNYYFPTITSPIFYGDLSLKNITSKADKDKKAA